jgi:hypothetical protein
LYKNVNEEVQIWSSGTDHYQNPQITNMQGEYAFLVEEGRYKLVVKASGYKNSETEWFEVTDKTIEKNIEMQRKVNYYLYIGIAVGILTVSSLVYIFIRKRKKKESNNKIVM